MKKKKIISIIVITLLVCSTVSMTTLYIIEKNNSWDKIVNNLPLLDRMLFYYEYCREYNFSSKKEWFDFSVNLILHATKQDNAFSNIDQYFESKGWEWLYGDSMNDSWICVEEFLSYCYRWSGNNTSNDIFRWLSSNIFYEYDGILVGGDENLTIEYIQSPLEVLFRKKGDCEDLAILGAAMFENNGFNTMIATINDPSYENKINETLEGLNHAFFFIEIDHYNDNLWFFEDEDRYWFLIDIEWMRGDIGSTPSWFYHYTNKTRCFNDWFDIMNLREIIVP